MKELPLRTLTAVLILSVLVSSNSNAEIIVDNVVRVFSKGGQVTNLEFSVAGSPDSTAKLRLSYAGNIADLKTGSSKPPRRLIFSNSAKTQLVFNIRYGIGIFTSYAVIEKKGFLSVIPAVGDMAYDSYLRKHSGRKGGSTVVEKFTGNTIHFIHLNAEGSDERWIYFSAKIDSHGNLVATE